MTRWQAGTASVLPAQRRLFTGMPCPRFQPGIQQTYDLALRARSRQIARNMASQYAMNVMDYRTSPKRAVELLKRSLSPGSTPTPCSFCGAAAYAVTVCRVRQG